MLNRLLRPQAPLRAASSLFQKPASAALPRFQFRGVHHMPQLIHGSNYKENGISEFLSPEAFDFAWTQYQSLMLDKLNLLTEDTVDADLKPADLLVKYSRRAEMASVFNHASMAHNNHFFFNCLSPVQTEIPDNLAKTIIDTCSSVESLKLDFLATANAMFGPGFVWLAKNLDRKGMIQIICTYNAGSPYPAAHARRQSVDMATNASLGNQYAGSMGSLSANTKELAPGALDLEPILCVNTWEHVWMMDYGVGGKAEYLERWWNRINWEVVLENYNAASTSRGNRTAGDWRRTI